MLLPSILAFSTFVASISAIPAAGSEPKELSRRQSTACAGNTATTRSEWCDYDLQTNYYDEVPDTGVTRELWWTIVNSTLAPDGRERQVWTVNGSFPGPTIEADWGDTVIVHVTNDLIYNGTTIHWHGVRQNYSNPQDGVPTITQCPTVPGNTTTYQWKATQYGTSWWHSHIGVQAWDGVAGGIIINGPASANYDNDVGTILLNDWDIQTMSSLVDSDELNGPPTLDNGLINGTNTYDDGTDVVGHRFNMSVTAGESYRIRLINAAIDTTFKFSIDNHTLQVIATDFVPIEPYSTDILNINIGQRYDLVVQANESAIASDFWIRAIPQLACSDNSNSDDIQGIFHYGNTTSPATPTTTGYSYVDECVDEPYASLVPSLALDVDEDYLYSPEENITLGFDTSNPAIFRWYVGNETFLQDWSDPTLLQIYENDLTTDFYPYNSTNAVLLPEANQWVYFIIEIALAVGHPIHLHGHDFYILAQGTGTYEPGVTTLNYINPPRRDTAFLLPSGHLVLAFQTDNPGAWICHCHIGWHQVNGLALQFIERESEIPAITDFDDIEAQCQAWNSFEATAASIKQTDDGI